MDGGVGRHTCGRALWSDRREGAETAEGGRVGKTRFVPSSRGGGPARLPGPWQHLAFLALVTSRPDPAGPGPLPSALTSL